jgi:hypothetical protein
MNIRVSKEAQEARLENLEDRLNAVLEEASSLSRAARAAAETFPPGSRKAADLLRTAAKIDAALALPDRDARMCDLIDAIFPELRN